jgi:signal transduction histidine kinase/CHASE3 domain sensor protein
LTNQNTHSERRAEQLVQAGVFFALACMAVIAIVCYRSVVQLNSEARWVAHSYQVLNGLESLQTALIDTQIGGRRFLATGDAEYLERYHAALPRVQSALQDLKGLTTDNADEQRRLQTLGSTTNERLAELADEMEVRRSQGADVAQRISPDTGRKLYDRFQHALDTVRGSEQLLLHDREERNRRASRTVEVVIVVGGAWAIGVTALTILALRRAFERRRRAELALTEANDALESRVRARTAQLAQSEAQLRSFVNATTDVIFRVSPDWREVRQMQEQEFTGAEAVAMRLSLDESVDPRDRPTMAATIDAAIRDRAIFELEHRIQRPDGSRSWIYSRAVPVIGRDGEILEWFGAASNVSARKDAQTRLQAQLARLSLLGQITRAIVERQDVGSIYQVVVQSLETHLSLSFCCVLLYDRASGAFDLNHVSERSAGAMLSGQPPLADAPGDLARCLQRQAIYEPNIGVARSAFLQWLARAGVESLVAVPLADEKEIIGVLVAGRPAPERFSSGEVEFLTQLCEHVALAGHQAELRVALQTAYDQLKQTQQAVMQQERLRALGQMASGIAHDINNAISPIALYTESLLESDPSLSPMARSHLEVMGRAIDDVTQTVTRMREFYRGREPQQRLEPVALNQIIPQVIELTRARWSDMALQRGASIEVRCELAPELPLIAGIESELRDALVNLIFNAVDAMPKGGSLWIRTREASDAGRAVEIEVADSGVGMDEETRRRCLEPFFTTKGERGTGLGLAMVYGMCQRNSADFELDSVVGQGTRVILRFAPAQTLHAGNATRPETRPVCAQRILLVDDDPLILKALSSNLEREGHDVVIANGGQAGIDCFIQAQGLSPFQTVITDLGMPGVDGRRVASAIKAAAPSTLVIMLTGWGRSMEEGDLPAHVDQVLGKPPKLQELREALTLTAAGG